MAHSHCFPENAPNKYFVYLLWDSDALSEFDKTGFRDSDTYSGTLTYKIDVDWDSINLLEIARKYMSLAK